MICLNQFGGIWRRTKATKRFTCKHIKLTQIYSISHSFIQGILLTKQMVVSIEVPTETKKYCLYEFSSFTSSNFKFHGRKWPSVVINDIVIIQKQMLLENPFSDVCVCVSVKTVPNHLNTKEPQPHKNTQCYSSRVCVCVC